MDENWGSPYDLGDQHIHWDWESSIQGNHQSIWDWNNILIIFLNHWNLSRSWWWHDKHTPWKAMLWPRLCEMLVKSGWIIYHPPIMAGSGDYRSKHVSWDGKSWRNMLGSWLCFANVAKSSKSNVTKFDGMKIFKFLGEMLGKCKPCCNNRTWMTSPCNV